MAKHALSEQVKKQKHRRAENAKMQRALDAWRVELEKPEGMSRKSIRRIALDCDVNYRTLARLAKGGVSMSAFNASKQKLKPPEERVVVDFIKESADRGLPLSRGEIVDVAESILASKHGEGPDSTVGDSWVDNFLTRHHDELQTHWSKPLDMQRAQSLNPAAKENWFKTVKEHVVDKGIPPELQFGMDETAIIDGEQGKQRVVGARGTKTQHKQGGGGRGENTTAIVTIAADGTALNPMLIFKGKRFRTEWNKNNIAECS